MRIRRGDAISAKLSITSLEHVFEKLGWKDMTMAVNDHDDEILIMNKVQTMLVALKEASNQVELKISNSKTKLMTNHIRISVCEKT